MGATTFCQTAKGRTVREAYDEAYRQAGYESGHGGYSGTIVEKSGYVEMPIPKGFTAMSLFDAFCGSSYEMDEPPTLTRHVSYRRTVTLKATETCYRDVPVDTEVTKEPSTVQWGVSNIDTRNAERLDVGEWEVVEVREPSEGQVSVYEAKVNLMKVPNVKRFAEIFDDKWGPALAVKSGKDEWTFMGYASC